MSPGHVVLRDKLNIVAGVLVVLIPQLVSAADWTFKPNLSLAETYTDNVTLASSSSPTESQWIAQVIPGFSLTGKGRELDLSLGYRMQSLFYFGNGDRNSVYHQLNSRAKATLLPRFLFLDATATQSQQVISPNAKQSVNNLAINASRENIKTASVSPYINTRLGRDVRTVLRASHDRVLYEKGAGQDSTGNGYDLRLSSSPSTTNWSWGLRLKRQLVDYEKSTSSTDLISENNNDAELTLGLRATHRVKLTALSGYEDHDYKYTSSVEQITDHYWRAGLIWEPGPRTSISAGGGKRFFGNTWYLAVVEKGRRNTLKIGYDESLATLRQYQLQESPPFRSTDPVTGEPILVSFEYLVPVNGVFVDHHAHATWTHSARKVTTSLTVSHSKRDYQLTKYEETVQSAGIILTDKLTRLEDISLSVRRESKLRDTGDEHFDVASLALKNKLGRHVSTLLEILHARNKSTGTATVNNYVENQMTASVTMSW